MLNRLIAMATSFPRRNRSRKVTGGVADALRRKGDWRRSEALHEFYQGLSFSRIGNVERMCGFRIAPGRIHQSIGRVVEGVVGAHDLVIMQQGCAACKVEF